MLEGLRAKPVPEAPQAQKGLKRLGARRCAKSLVYSSLVKSLQAYPRSLQSATFAPHCFLYELLAGSFASTAASVPGARWAFCCLAVVIDRRY